MNPPFFKRIVLSVSIPGLAQPIRAGCVGNHNKYTHSRFISRHIHSSLKVTRIRRRLPPTYARTPVQVLPTHALNASLIDRLIV